MFKTATFVLMAVVCLINIDQSALGQNQPNIIFILADDLGWGDIGVLHQNSSTHPRRHKTPYLDQMARDGLLMPQHYCPAPVCAPSRASFLMGVHQGHASVRNNQFDKALNDNHTVATVLKDAGYKTALIGKYGLQGEGKDSKSWEAYPTKRGFDEFFGYVAHGDGHVHYPSHPWPIGNSESHRVGKPVWWNDREVSGDLARCYTTDLFTARSKQWIIEHRESKPDQPFFLYLAFDTPHAALQVPTSAYPEGLGLNGGVRWIGEPGRMINTASGTIDSYRHPDYVGKGWSDVQERFATMVRRIDDCVGDILVTLNDLNISKNTLVVFTSDNGPHDKTYIQGQQFEASDFQSYGPFDGTKRDTWEGGIRMPTIAWWPETIPKSSVHLKPTQFHDWMATFAEIAGVLPPARTDGVSMMNSLKGSRDRKPSRVYVEYEHRGKTKSYSTFLKSRAGTKRGQMQVIHLDGYKGIRTNIKSHADPFEIYHLESDLGERKNLANTGGKFAELEQRMRDQVLRLRVADSSAPRPYDSEFIPGFEKSDELKTRGDLSVKGKFKYVPDLSASSIEEAIDPDAKGIVLKGKQTSFSANLKCPKGGAVMASRTVQVTQSGRYKISLQSKAKVFIRLHEAAIIDADFHREHGQDSFEVELNLGKGFHPLLITGLPGEEDELAVTLHFKRVGENAK
ncbi:arylsulfatase [bacterium]|nr:arylsulfatase [bacterium]MDA7924846.1 arylsulfatase [Mariniblastus sp.]